MNGPTATLVHLTLVVPDGADAGQIGRDALAQAGALPLSSTGPSPLFVLSGHRWPQFFDGNPRPAPVTDLYNPAGQTFTGGADAAVAAAGQTWTDVPTATFALGFAGGTSAGKGFDSLNVVSWPSPWPNSVSAVAVTTTTFNVVTGFIFDADVELNRNSVMSLDPPASGDVYDFQRVLLHEFGHLAGLDHSLAPGAVMYAFGAPGPQSHTLAQDDINALSTLYPPPATWILASSVHAGGANGAFYTTDLGVANYGSTDASFTMQFLGNNQDGRTGPVKSFTLAAGKSVLYSDVVSSVFGLSGAFGSIRITANAPSLKISSVTSTPGGVPGGTFGSGIPAASASDWVVNGTPRAMTMLREDTKNRTNLVVANATESGLDVSYVLQANDGSILAQGALPTFAPLEMRQINRVIQNLMGSPAPVANATLILSTPTAGGAFAAFCSLIDNLTNDPRTLLP